MDTETDSGGPDSYIDFSNLVIIGRERYLNGTLKVLEPLNDKNCAMEIKISNDASGDGNYKTLPFGYKKSDCCTIFKKVYPTYIQGSVENRSNLVHVENDEGLCPYPAGEYWLKNIEVDTTNWPNQLPRGMLKVTFYMYKDNVKTHTTNLYAQIEDV